MAKDKKNKHHFIPAAYLAGFGIGTPSIRKRNYLIHVIDKNQKKKFINTCSNVALRHRYYKIDVDEFDEDAIEDEFASIEGKSLKIIENICLTHELPVGDEYKILMYFLGLMATRIPTFRDQINKMLSEIIKLTGKVYFNNERLDEIADNLKKSGVDLGDKYNIEELKNFVMNGDYSVLIDKGFNLGISLQMASELYKLLHERTWYLYYRTDNMNNHFVTSDSPLILTWNDDRTRPYSPGFGLPDTLVIFPLNHNVVLLGEFGKEQPGPFKITNEIIKRLNTFQVSFAQRFIYSYTDEFKYMVKEKRILSSNILVENK